MFWWYFFVGSGTGGLAGSGRGSLVEGLLAVVLLVLTEFWGGVGGRTCGGYMPTGASRSWTGVTASRGSVVEVVVAWGLAGRGCNSG